MEQVILETKCGCRRMISHDMKRGDIIFCEMMERLPSPMEMARMNLGPDTVRHSRREFRFNGMYDMIDRRPFKIFREI